MNVDLKHGDCIEVLKTMEEGSVGSIVCDPPYDLVANSRNGSPQPGDLSTPYGRSGPSKARGFMGKEWDGTGIAFSPELWGEVCRVLKPNGVVKAFGGTRTYHKMAAAMERAGLVDLRLEAWCYGSGFPKSKNIALFLDKRAKATGNRGRAIPVASTHLPGEGKYGKDGEKLTSNIVETYEPRTPEAEMWNGWGTALKPAWEPIIVGRKEPIVVGRKP